MASLTDQATAMFPAVAAAAVAAYFVHRRYQEGSRRKADSNVWHGHRESVLRLVQSVRKGPQDFSFETYNKLDEAKPQFASKHLRYAFDDLLRGVEIAGELALAGSATISSDEWQNALKAIEERYTRLNELVANCTDAPHGNSSDS